MTEDKKYCTLCGFEGVVVDDEQELLNPMPPAPEPVMSLRDVNGSLLCEICAECETEQVIQ